MKLKLDEQGHVVVKDGMPVYVHDDGKEIPFNAATTVATITRLNGEAKGHRERAEAAEEKLKVFEPIKDVTAALSALDTVGKLDAKKLIDVGAVDKVREEAQKAFDARLKSIEEAHVPIIKERDSLRQALVDEKVGGSFARSKFVAERLAIPADMVQSKFGSAFKLEDGKVVAYNKDGKQVFSRAKPGEVADFDEALEILVDAYPHKEHIYKGSGASGGGAHNTNGGGKRTVTRAQLAQMTPADQANVARAAREGAATIVDG